MIQLIWATQGSYCTTHPLSNLLFRNYVCIDILQRVLREFFDVNVVHIMGMTDVDDKIIKRAKEQNSTLNDVAHKFEKEFQSDMLALGVISNHSISLVHSLHDVKGQTACCDNESNRACTRDHRFC